MCFVKSKDEFFEGIRFLEDIIKCLELKMDFPYENVIIDVIQYGGLLLEAKEDEINENNEHI